MRGSVLRLRTASVGAFQNGLGRNPRDFLLAVEGMWLYFSRAGVAAASKTVRSPRQSWAAHRVKYNPSLSAQLVRYCVGCRACVVPPEIEWAFRWACGSRAMSTRMRRSWCSRRRCWRAGPPRAGSTRPPPRYGYGNRRDSTIAPYNDPFAKTAQAPTRTATTCSMKTCAFYNIFTRFSPILSWLCCRFFGNNKCLNLVFSCQVLAKHYGNK